MKVFLLFLLSLILLFLQIAAIDSINIYIFKINFFYILVLSVVFSLKNKNIYESIIFSMLLGLIIDLFNASLSFYSVNFAIMTIIANNISEKISFSFIQLFIVITLSTFFVEIINATLIGFFYYGLKNELSYQIFRENLVPYIIGNNIIGYIFNLLFETFENK
jgi:rod shape-determining protein MreD